LKGGIGNNMRKKYLKKGYLMKVPGRRKKTRVKPQLVKLPKK